MILIGTFFSELKSILPILYTSSHGRRYLGTCLREAFDPNFKYHCPVLDWESNRRLTGYWVNEMISDAKRREPENQVILMGLGKLILKFQNYILKIDETFFAGDNNLRRLEENPDDFLRLVERLIVGMSRIQNCHLVLISLLPSLENNDECKEAFLKVNSAFQKFAGQKYLPENVSYLNAAKHFMHKGRVDATLYRDGVHMNFKGSAQYANIIKSHLKRLPNRYFDL